MKLSVFSILFWGGYVTIASAAGVSDCDQALIISTYSNFSSDHVDYRLASLVTQDTYDKISGSHGASAIIYGIPMSDSWSGFKNNVANALNRYNTSMTRNQAINIMWTGLDTTAASAYSKCLEEVAFSSAGLHLAAKAATASDISIAVKYAADFYSPKILPVTWTANVPTVDGKPFPNVLYSGVSSTGIVVVRRPSVEQTIAIHSTLGDDSIVLEPLQPIPTPSPTPTSVVSARCNNLQGKWSCPNRPENCTIEKKSDYEFELSHGSGKTMMHPVDGDDSGWQVDANAAQNWTGSYATTILDCTALIFTNDDTMWGKR